MANIDLVMRLLAEDRASDKFKKVGDSAKRTESSFKGLGRTAAGALAGIGVAAFAKQSITKFAEMQDAQSALQATYGQTADAFTSFANDSADALNLSKKEALGAAQTFANFGSAAGLTGKQLQTFTTPLIERAADAASYFGGSTSDAIEAFGAALRGEMEPIRKYGVLLDDATLRAKALEMGLISSTKNALTPQQKTLAAQALILEKTSQAQGDVARTSDSMANRIKDAQQQMDDFQTSIGETLSTAIGPLLGALNTGMSTFNKLPQPIKSASVGVTILGAAAVVVVPKMVALKVAMIEAGVSSAALGKGAKATGKALGLLGIAATAGAAIGSFQKVTVNAGKSTDDLATSLADLASSTGGLAELNLGFKSSAGSVGTFSDALGTVRDNSWLDQLGQWGASLVGVTTSFGMAQQSVEQVDAALAALQANGKGQEAALAFSKLADEALASGTSIDDLKAALPQYAAAQAAATKPVTAATIELRKQGDAVKTVEHAFKVLQGILDKGAATDAWITALKDVAKQAKESGGQILGTKEAALKLRGQVRDDVAALTTYAETFKNPAKKAEVLRDGLLKIREGLIKGGVKPADVDKFLAPLSKAAVDGYTKAKKIGHAINDGLVSGLKDRATAIAEAKALGAAAVRAVAKGAEVQSPSKYTTWVGGEIANGLTVGIKAKAGQSKKAIEALTKSATAAAGKMLDAWKAKADGTLSRFREVRDNVVGSGSVAGFQASEDTPTTAGNIISSMAGRVAEAKKFVTAIKDLRKMGLNKGSIREIIAAGPHDGLAIAEALLAGGKGAVGEVNSLESQLNAAGTALGGFAAQMDYGITVSQALGNPQVVAKQASAGGAVNVVLTVDGKVLQTVLVDLKRSQGGSLKF